MIIPIELGSFSEDGETVYWVHGSGTGDSTPGDLLHPSGLSGGDKRWLMITDTTNTRYPMAGGRLEQELHQYHLEADTLENVQADATARGIDTGGKTQAELIVLIIQDECVKNDVRYQL